MLLDRYLHLSKRFYYSLFFILPFLFVYEVGLMKGALGENINGADAILRIFFIFIYSVLGKTATFILVGLVLAGLIGFVLYYIITFKVKIQWRYFLYMLAESLLLAMLLTIIVHLLLTMHWPKFFTFASNAAVTKQLAVIGLDSFWSRIVASIGAGIFEEFVFRVFLMRAFYAFWSRTKLGEFGRDPGALVKSLLASSVIFTGLHLGSVGSIFGLVSIFIGSVLFSIVYAKRGYGIAAATHVFYDMYLMFGVVA